jgi:P27 family predicted phage terminase small subunit
MLTPPAPSHLSPEAKEWWDRLVSEYMIDDACGLLLLQSAMEAHDSLRQAEAAIAKHGITYVDRFQQVKSHPCASIVRDSRAQMVACLRALNLDIEPPKAVGRPPGS